MPTHVLFEPEWVIEADGRGSFRIECECGWQEGGFDTTSLARAAGFTHSTGAPPPSTGGTEAPPTPPKQRWWRR